MKPMPRRTFAAAGALIAGLGGLVTLTPGPAAATSTQKNVIYMVGDGMGWTHVTAGRQRFYGAAGALDMERSDATGHVSTYAVEPGSTKPDLVTDSASSGTAWSSGVKTYNAALGVDAFGEQVDTLMEQAKEDGYRTGNVTTSEVTDATPAAMMSHVLLRGCQGPDHTAAACLTPALADGLEDDNPLLITPVAEQIARNGTADVVFGGGLSRFEPDDADALRAQGYDVLGSFGDPALAVQTAASQRVATRSELNRIKGTKVIGLFNRGNLTVEKTKQDRRGAFDREPTLAESTAKAIELLEAGGEDGPGFLLQVEGALIDKRSHANDAAQTLEEIKAFDDAVRVAKEYAATQGNTLVITTADHECAGFNIIGKGSSTNAEATLPPTNNDSTNPANDSTPPRTTRGALDPTRSAGPVNSPTGTPSSFAPATFGTPDDGTTDHRRLDGTVDASLWLTYLSGNHTGADVPVFAVGPGAEAFAGKTDNTEHYRIMKDALGV